MSDEYSIAVIGGGAAGLMAGISVLYSGGSCTVYERNRFAGKKLRITGKGRCNVTNNCTPEEMLREVTRNEKFLFSSLYTFTPADTMEFFENAGVPLKTERGRRVFPVSDRAHDIADALVDTFLSLGGKIEYNTRITGIVTDGEKAVGVRIGDRTVRHEAVILATGGVSYQGTGSDGDGHKMANELGIKTTPLSPSLVPIVCREKLSDMMGLSLKNVKLSVFHNGSAVYSEMGEMLFTHFGVSGPLVLSASAHMQKHPVGEYRMEIDLKPALDDETLDKRLISDLSKYSSRDFVNSLGDLLPKKLIPSVIRLSEIPEHIRSATVTKEMRKKLLNILKHYPLTPAAFRPINEAIVTCGGIDVSEISPNTMMSKKLPGLFFAGEIIDCDAYTGGYNLQIAWSTGRKAGEAAVKYTWES